MSDDLNNKIKQIAEMLGGQEGMPDNIKGLISLLASSGGPGGPSESIQKAVESPKTPEVHIPLENSSTHSELDENLEMVRRVKKVMDRMSTANDPRVNLLTAVKPFLNNDRQKKLGNCIKILMMSNMARFVDEFDKS